MLSLLQHTNVKSRYYKIHYIVKIGIKAAELNFGNEIIAQIRHNYCPIKFGDAIPWQAVFATLFWCFHSFILNNSTCSLVDRVKLVGSQHDDHYFTTWWWQRTLVLTMPFYVDNVHYLMIDAHAAQSQKMLSGLRSYRSLNSYKSLYSFV